MDKNTITGLVLMGLLLIGFSWWSQPSSEQKAEMMRQDSIAAVMKQKAETSKKNAEAKHLAEQKAKQEADTTALFHEALQGEAQNIVLKNEKLNLTLSTKGGTVTKAVIKGFKDKEGNKIPYDDYLKLSDMDKEAYTVSHHTTFYHVFNIEQTSFPEKNPEAWEQMKERFTIEIHAQGN
ncbi:MAG: hypothetical protein KHX29_06960, partial [Prevotella buccalis]|nr:hypothetical protein [Hoylesella buccalis]